MPALPGHFRLSDGKRIIDLDSEVADRTFHFLVAKQKLDRAQVTGATVDQLSCGGESVC
jgi:hypothetical protein